MYAIVEIGKKLHKVEDGSEIEVDLLDVKKDEKLTFDTITFYRDDKNVLIGTPYVKGAKVEAMVIDEDVKGEKITVFNYKAKSNWRKRRGHRQHYTKLKINKISAV